MDNNILQIEREIDEAFSNNPLLQTGYTKSVLALLSVVDLNFVGNGSVVFFDSLLNALTHPIRICHKLKKMDKKQSLFLVKNDIDLAQTWISESLQYNDFCSIFPLIHNNLCNFEIKGNVIFTDYLKRTNTAYEAYDRFHGSNFNNPSLHGEENHFNEIRLKLEHTKESFPLKFSPKLARLLSDYFSQLTQEIYKLPSNWQFYFFSIGDFTTTVKMLQALVLGWFSSVSIQLNKNGLTSEILNSIVWKVNKKDIQNMLCRYTGIDRAKTIKILEYLTFGELGISNPDIALQPLIELDKENYALSSFVWLGLNVERNLCVLLNQIPNERAIYLNLINRKEEIQKQVIIASLSETSFETKSGEILGTNIDLAIIDRANRACLTIELKWFLEPAEIREIVNKSQELEKGVKQSLIVSNAFSCMDKTLFRVLDINESFDFLSIVCSENSIGDDRVQNIEIPIIKMSHLMEMLREKTNLCEVIAWLKKRDYLPKEGIDYINGLNTLVCGKWSTSWYGIDFLSETHKKSLISVY